MPITTVTSYTETMEEFVYHWTLANAEIAPVVLVLRGSYGLADFVADRDAIRTAITFLSTVDIGARASASHRDTLKRNARARIGQFRSMVLALLAGTPNARNMPKVPPFESNSSIILKAARETAKGWGRIDTEPIPGFTGPLLLAGGYSLADFIADVAALDAAYRAANDAESDARQARRVRDSLFAPARQRMVQYRMAVRGFLDPGSALMSTVPAFSPRPGATPKPVEVTAVWNEATQMADLSWTPSDNKNLKSYSIRMSPGPKYRTAVETVVGSASKKKTVFSTKKGLTTPGATALYRVYVVLTTGNERGSNTVAVTRPG